MPAGFPINTRRYAVTIAATTTFLVGLPGIAAAHGVDGAGKSIPEFVWLGIVHMITGWDHLLFVVGVVLLARQARRAAALISLFALGHSVTLIGATMAEYRLGATTVDVIIALSVVFVGAVGLFAKPQTGMQWRWFGAAVAGFGLIHGLGLSTRLQEIDVHALSRVIAFNIGVEIGQLLAILVVVAIGSRIPARFTTDNARRLASIALVVAGVVAAGVLVSARLTRTESATTAASGPCVVHEGGAELHVQGFTSSQRTSLGVLPN